MSHKEILNEDKINHLIFSISKQMSAFITEKTVLIGIDLRGKVLAKRLQKQCLDLSQLNVEVGTIDTSLYRDLTNKSYINIGETNIPFSLKNKHVILVVECLKSGSSIYAALNALSAFNEPASIEVTALIDMQKLVYPFSTKFIGQSIKLDQDNDVEVQFFEIDGVDAVVERISEKII